MSAAIRLKEKENAAASLGTLAYALYVIQTSKYSRTRSLVRKNPSRWKRRHLHTLFPTLSTMALLFDLCAGRHYRSALISEYLLLAFS